MIYSAIRSNGQMMIKSQTVKSVIDPSVFLPESIIVGAVEKYTAMNVWNMN